MRSRLVELWSLRTAACAALALLLVAGCGGGYPYGTIPVKGKVTYKDGSLIPAERIEITFVPQIDPKDEKTHAKLGMTNVDVETGEFDTVTTYKYGDGVTIGKHKVQIKAFGEGGVQLPLVPPAYADVAATPIEEIEVGPDSTEFHFEVEKP